MKKKLEKFGVLVVILLLGVIYQRNYFNEFPSHIHAWAQSDRYALAYGFVDNGLDFFKPQTFVYNHQFPDKWKVPSETTITAVDFPIHDYIPAVFMKITGIHSPLVFRMYILFYSFIGLYFLFKLSFAFSKDYLKSVFIVVFAATSPVFVYYQAGFLPTIPSLSNAIIGSYFYYRFIYEDKNKYFWMGVLFLTFATLSRTTFAIPLIAVFGVEFIRILRKESNLKAKLLPVCISILLLFSYHLYNGFLRDKYGSLFLNYILPPSSFDHAKEMIKTIYQNWFFQYFTKPHYLILVITIVSSIFYSIYRKFQFQKGIKNFAQLTFIYFLGCLIFAFLMLVQFPDHDYYFLDTFYLPIVMMMIFFMSLFPVIEKRNHKVISFLALSLISIFLLIQPVKTQEKRRETGFWDRTEVIINSYKESSLFLDSIGIPKDSKMLVLGTSVPNIPFILMQRKGFAIMNTNRENCKSALNWDFDYIVIENEFFIPEIYKTFPEIISKIKKIADNGKISICTLSDNPNQNLLDFMGLNNRVPLVEKIVTFEVKPDRLWQNYHPNDMTAYKSNFSGYLASNMEYGLTYKTKDLNELKTNSRTLFFSSFFQKDTSINCELVVSINEKGKNIYYKSTNLNAMIKHKGRWEKLVLMYQLPKIQNDDYELSIFIWNIGKSELYYDDFGFSIY